MGREHGVCGGGVSGLLRLSYVIRPGCTAPRRAPEKPAVPDDLLRLSHVVRRAWSRPSARADAVADAHGEGHDRTVERDLARGRERLEA